MKKKLFAILMAFVMIFSLCVLTGCGDKSDVDKLVVGLDDTFAPMGFRDSDGNLVGFDIDLANAVAEELGCEIEFKPIDWDAKEMELEAKTIDCVWNGMTLTDEVTSAMDCSNAYCNNAQVVIVPADKADKYQTVDSLSDLTFAVEAGSAGETEANTIFLTVEPNGIGKIFISGSFSNHSSGH